MKKILAIVILALSVGASAFAWNDWSEYEAFCMLNGIEPSYEEFEYYADKGGQCYPCADAEELENIMKLSKN